MTSQHKELAEIFTPGDRIGEYYRIARRIGEGSYGMVFRAIDDRNGRTVAVKVISPTVSRESSTAMGRFQREMKVIRNLDHPNIISLFDWGHTDQGLIYMVLEFIDGHTLSEVVRHNPMDVQTALDTLSQLASALAAAHEAGVVHRDLKPANIMLVPEDDGYQVKVLDFGMAKVMVPLDDESILDLTREGAAVGTPRYIAPEQAKGKEVGPAADLYGVGLLMYELFTGVQAVRVNTVEAAVAAHVSSEPLELEEVDLVPSTVQPILYRLLEKDPQRRMQSGAELVAALADPQWQRESFLPDVNTSEIKLGPALGDMTGDFPGAGGLDKSDCGQGEEVSGSPEVALAEAGGVEELELDLAGNQPDPSKDHHSDDGESSRHQVDRDRLARQKRLKRDEWLRLPRTAGEWGEGAASVVLIPLTIMAVGAQAAGFDFVPRLAIALAAPLGAWIWALSRDSGDWNESFGRRGWLCCTVAIVIAHLLGPTELATELTRNPGWFLRPFDALPGMAFVESAVTSVSRQWAGVIFSLFD